MLRFKKNFCKRLSPRCWQNHKIEWPSFNYTQLSSWTWLAETTCWLYAHSGYILRTPIRMHLGNWVSFFDYCAEVILLCWARCTINDTDTSPKSYGVKRVNPHTYSFGIFRVASKEIVPELLDWERRCWQESW